MIPFQLDWQKFYGDTPPLSFALREAGVGHWLRFHSLPQSKRYAESDVERQIILDRAAVLARAVLQDAPCWLVQATVRETPSSATPDLNLPLAGEYHYDEGDWLARAAIVQFKTGAFDRLLMDIANERGPRSLWMRPDNGRVFAPYDGGFDLFLETSEEVERLAARHSRWLSDHPDGL